MSANQESVRPEAAVAYRATKDLEDLGIPKGAWVVFQGPAYRVRCTLALWDGGGGDVEVLRELAPKEIAGLFPRRDALSLALSIDGKAEHTLLRHLCQWIGGRPAYPSTVSEPIRADTDEGALFELLAQTKCRMPKEGG